MKIFKLILNLLLVCSITLSYYLFFIFLNYRNCIIFTIITDILIIALLLCKLLKSSEKKRIISTIVIFVTILYCKSYSDYKNLTLIKKFSSNSSIYELLKPKVSALIDNKDYEMKFKIDNKESAKIYYTDDFEPVLDLVHAYLNKAKEDNIKLFGNIKVQPVKIEFDYDKAVFEKRDPSFKDYSGLYSAINKTIYVYISDCYKDIKSTYFRYILLHEYNHHMFYQFLNSNKIDMEKIPAWFIEGTAEFAGNEDYPGAEPEKILDLNQLNTNSQWTNYNNKGYSVYEESHYAVRWLIHMKGENAVKDILLKTKSMDFNTAFKQVSGMSLENYQDILKADSRNGWEKYRQIKPAAEINWFYDVKAECLEKYIKKNSDNIDAMIDLSELYENSGSLEKSKAVLEGAVKRKPKNEMAWLRLGLLYDKLNDFDNAVKTFEKLVIINPKSSPFYMDLAESSLITDINRAASAAEKAGQLEKSSYVKKQTKAILDYKNYIKNGKPFEGCLKLINSNTIFSVNVKKALVDKLLKEYPNIKNSSRSKLEKIW